MSGVNTAEKTMPNISGQVLYDDDDNEVYVYTQHSITENKSTRKITSKFHVIVPSNVENRYIDDKNKLHIIPSKLKYVLSDDGRFVTTNKNYYVRSFARNDNIYFCYYDRVDEKYRVYSSTDESTEILTSVEEVDAIYPIIDDDKPKRIESTSSSTHSSIPPENIVYEYCQDTGLLVPHFKDCYGNLTPYYPRITPEEEMRLKKKANEDFRMKINEKMHGWLTYGLTQEEVEVYNSSDDGLTAKEIEEKNILKPSNGLTRQIVGKYIVGLPNVSPEAFEIFLGELKLHEKKRCDMERTINKKKAEKERIQKEEKEKLEIIKVLDIKRICGNKVVENLTCSNETMQKIKQLLVKGDMDSLAEAFIIIKGDDIIKVSEKCFFSFIHPKTIWNPNDDSVFKIIVKSTLTSYIDMYFKGFDFYVDNVLCTPHISEIYTTKMFPIDYDNITDEDRNNILNLEYWDYFVKRDKEMVKDGSYPLEFLEDDNVLVIDNETLRSNDEFVTKIHDCHWKYVQSGFTFNSHLVTRYICHSYFVLNKCKFITKPMFGEGLGTRKKEDFTKLIDCHRAMLNKLKGHEIIGKRGGITTVKSYFDVATNVNSLTAKIIDKLPTKKGNWTYNPYYIPIKGNKIVDVRNLSVIDRTNEYFFTEEVCMDFDVDIDTNDIRTIMEKMVGIDNFDKIRYMLALMICPINQENKHIFVSTGYDSLFKLLLEGGLNCLYSYRNGGELCNANKANFLSSVKDKRILGYDMIGINTISDKIMNKLLSGGVISLEAAKYPDFYLNLNIMLFCKNVSKLGENFTNLIYPINFVNPNLSIDNMTDLYQKMFVFSVLCAHDMYNCKLSVPENDQMTVTPEHNITQLMFDRQTIAFDEFMMLRGYNVTETEYVKLKYTYFGGKYKSYDELCNKISNSSEQVIINFNNFLNDYADTFDCDHIAYDSGGVIKIGILLAMYSEYFTSSRLTRVSLITNEKKTSNLL